MREKPAFHTPSVVEDFKTTPKIVKNLTPTNIQKRELRVFGTFVMNFSLKLIISFTRSYKSTF